MRNPALTFTHEFPMKYNMSPVSTLDGSPLLPHAPRFHIESYTHPKPHLCSYKEPDIPNGEYGCKLIGLGETILKRELRGPWPVFSYKAPEALFESQIGPEADIWGLGMMVR